MKLFYNKNSKDPIYYVQHGFRDKLTKRPTTKNIFRIGKHSELLKDYPDPLLYAKTVTDNYNKQLKSDLSDFNISINFNENIPSSSNISSKSTSLNIGYFILQLLYRDLKLNDFFTSIQLNRKHTYNFNDINRFLTFARILDPKSKLSTFDNLSTYFEQPTFDYHQILRFLPNLASHYEDYIKWLFINSENIIKRDTSVCFYDCSNYYFEIDTEDEDYIDEVTNEAVKGLRKFAKSKDYKPNPVVQMGLFMDIQGIPISMCITHGSQSEQKTVIPLESEMIKMFHNKKFIYCADAGLGSLDIRLFNSMGGKAFIVTQSIKKLSDDLKKIVFDDSGYRLLSNKSKVSIDFMKSFDKFDSDNLSLYNDKAYKVINIDSSVDLGLFEEKVLKNGKTKTIKSAAYLPQRIIITFSRKMFEYQRNIRKRHIERAANLINNNRVEDKKKGSNDITRLIKRTSLTSCGDIANTNIYDIDLDIISNEEQYDGFYAIATNLSDKNIKNIIEISSNRYKIEDCFRVLKTNFEARPVYHHNRENIIAHFMICYTALLIYRLLEAKLKAKNYHFTINQIISTLKNMSICSVKDLYYQALYTGSDVLSALENVFELDLEKKNYHPNILNKKIKKILK